MPYFIYLCYGKDIMNIVVTGATGYIGTHFCREALQHGHNIVIGTRRTVSSSNSKTIFFDLTSVQSIEMPSDTDVVLHLAANTHQNNGLNEQSEVDCASRLINSAKKINARFIFISSQVARSNAPSAYGRIKWRIEQEVLKNKGFVVRPGLVYGGFEEGIFGRLTDLVKRLPILPAFYPAPMIQPIHVNDLVEGLIKIVENSTIESCALNLASSESITFHSFLSIISKSRVRSRRWFLPVPVIIIQSIHRILGPRYSSRLGLEQLDSLFKIPRMETGESLTILNLSLRSVVSGMHKSGKHRRRELFREGRALLTYILRESPPNNLLCRYVRAIEKVSNGLSLALPEWGIRRPARIAMLDINSLKDSPLSYRLDIATMLAEATPIGAKRFLNYPPDQRLLRGISTILLSILMELYWRFFQWMRHKFYEI